MTGIVRCWETEGVTGDRSCSKLAQVAHCRNCAAYVAAGREFLNRPPPENYRDELTATLARQPVTAPRDELQVMIFRLGEEWLALPTKLLKRVTEPRPSHHIPHRGGLLLGLVNVDGELHLLIQLEHLLGIARHPSVHTPSTHARLLMIELRGATWAFSVDEVWQLAQVSAAALSPPPATLAATPNRHTRGTFTLQKREVALLDEALLIRDLEARLGGNRARSAPAAKVPT